MLGALIRSSPAVTYSSPPQEVRSADKKSSYPINNVHGVTRPDPGYLDPESSQLTRAPQAPCERGDELWFSGQTQALGVQRSLTGGRSDFVLGDNWSSWGLQALWSSSLESLLQQPTRVTFYQAQLWRCFLTFCTSVTCQGREKPQQPGPRPPLTESESSRVHFRPQCRAAERFQVVPMCDQTEALGRPWGSHAFLQLWPLHTRFRTTGFACQQYGFLGPSQIY